MAERHHSSIVKTNAGLHRLSAVSLICWQAGIGANVRSYGLTAHPSSGGIADTS